MKLFNVENHTFCGSGQFDEKTNSIGLKLCIALLCSSNIALYKYFYSALFRVKFSAVQCSALTGCRVGAVLVLFQMHVLLRTVETSDLANKVLSKYF